MKHILRDPITDATAWRASDFKSENDWMVELSPAHLDELHDALASLQKNNSLGFGREAFQLPSLGPVLEDVSDEIQNGRGFAVIRGLDISQYQTHQLERLLWGIGTYLGAGIVQNADGDLIGRVTDHGETYAGTDPYKSGIRGYRTRVALPPHTDSCDVVGLMCVRKAKSGGESSVVSAMAIYNEIIATRPDLLEALCEGFHIDLVGKGTAADQVSFKRIPVFSYFGGKLSCRYNKRQIEIGAEKSGQPLSHRHQEAIDLVRELSLKPKFRLAMDLAPGDIQFLNNRITLHARETFEDHDAPDKKRVMLRLWLSTPGGRPLAPELADQLNTGPRGGVHVRA